MWGGKSSNGRGSNGVNTGHHLEASPAALLPPGFSHSLFTVCVFQLVEAKGSAWFPGIQLRLVRLVGKPLYPNEPSL